MQFNNNFEMKFNKDFELYFSEACEVHFNNDYATHSKQNIRNTFRVELIQQISADAYEPLKANLLIHLK